MAKLSKYYKVTRQIMIEYISDQLNPNILDNSVLTTYTIYTGYDDNVYYTEVPRAQTNMYNNALYFIKFPDESGASYTYLGLLKQEDGTYSNTDFLNDEMLKYVKGRETHVNKKMYYDKIRIHFVYGFLLDKLAGFSLQVKTTANYLGPVLCHHDNSLTHMKFDDKGNPVFETETGNFIIEEMSGEKRELNNVTLEPLVMNTKDFILLDYFFPKECLNFDKLVKYHKVPIYQNECFYDRYIEIDVPSAYYLSMDGGNVPLTVQNNYGYSGDVLKTKGNKYYTFPSETPEDRKITYNILPDPQLIISFATVSQENAKDSTVEPLISGGVYGTSYPITYARTFFLDPINEIAINYISNSDFFNVRIFEDTENNEITYYPVFGDRELDLDLFNEIESGAIPLITEAFYDGLDNVESFYNLYGENAYKWVIYNDISVTYNFSPVILNTDSTNMISSSTTQHFTNIIDYGLYRSDEGPFWKNSFIPRVPKRNNMLVKSILISYTCRLANRLTGVEAIRSATLSVIDPTIYVSRRVSINNVTTYKIVNQIKRQNMGIRSILRESNDKLIRCYYDATNIVVKDMATNSLYTLGQMTLYLKHTSSNYLFRLFTLNDDNVRIPFDLTGPYRYKLVFPTNKGEKITIRPNTLNTDLNLGIGQLVFFISEEYVKQIMDVPLQDRYFAIMTDVESSEQMQSTLYEGKVSYYQ